jgi:hypothetical protein
MNGTVATEQLYCANCSDPVDAVDEDGNGRCCHNLPHPWHRGLDGLYVLPSESATAEAEDEREEEDEDDLRPSCPFCGERNFTIHALEWHRIALTQTVGGYDNEEWDDSTLWYDSDGFEEQETIETDNREIQQVLCDSCHQDVSGRITVEES